MRIILKFSPGEQLSYDSINKYTIQGFIYSLFKETPFSNYHDFKGFKFFCFSNIFPVSDFKPKEIKNLIISSPKEGFIRTLFDVLKKKEYFYLGKYRMEIMDVRIFQPKLTRRFITSTPIVLFENSRENKYYSIKKTNDFSFFMDRIKENALKKYNAYQNSDYYFEGNLFDRFEFDREVAVRIKKADNMFLIIGTLWKNLEKFNMDDKRFYKFLMDTGIGEKNSLGFGMLNPVG
ncbi:MAG: CRISPR-associated endoribonuclease Cas6 [Methanobacterium sp.]|nr:MAG: CRISPR-associated endoribonuclease Cas6 [Methanobacterium sp.]